jgi:predicted PurR-regulated permease PerM
VQVPQFLTGGTVAPAGHQPAPAEPTVRARLEVPTRTIVKVALALLVLWLGVRLASVLLEVFCALLLTAALDPLVTRLEGRGWRRSTAVAALLGVLLAVTAGLLALTVPPLIRQGTQLATDLPGYLDRSQPYFRDHPKLYTQVHTFLDTRAKDPSLYLSHAQAVGTGVVTFVTRSLLVLTMTAYLLVADGERSLFRLFGYLPPAQRAKVRRALPEVSRVVSGYAVGQVVTSTLFGLFAFGVCLALGVPQPLLLALLAAVADAVPIVGAVLATAPAVLLALTVSPTAAIVVFALYAAYQQVENHVIVPRVYRSTLQISSFGVLVAVAIGAQLLGVVGALIALPVAAAIPVIERIWREDQGPPPAPDEVGLAPAPWETPPTGAGPTAAPPVLVPEAQS